MWWKDKEIKIKWILTCSTMKPITPVKITNLIACRVTHPFRMQVERG